MDTSQTCLNLIGQLAWPLTVIFACILFYGPLSKLLETISRRATKFSAFKVDIELGRLSQARSIAAAVEGLKKVAVNESGAPQIVATALQSGSADYVSLDIGKNNDEWLTSRLFLLAAILERSRAVRCIVFQSGERFLGAATPRDVRAALGARFLAYESAFANAYCGLAGAEQDAFRGGLSEGLVNTLSKGFLTNALIVRPSEPQVPVVPPQPSRAAAGWVKLERQNGPTTWEFAEWLTFGGLREMLGAHLMTGAVVAAVGAASAEVTRSIILSTGSFVGLIDRAGAFLDLCDRYAMLDTVARQAVEQSSE